MSAKLRALGREYNERGGCESKEQDKEVQWAGTGFVMSRLCNDPPKRQPIQPLTLP